MNEGRVVQIGAPREIYERPRNRFVADFVGTTNFLDAKVISGHSGNGHCQVSTPFGTLGVQCGEALGTDTAVVISVRPEDIELTEQVPQHADGINVITGTVHGKAFLGEYLDFQVKVGDRILLARAHPSLRTPIGEPIHMRMRVEKCVAIPNA